jgi:hypothetical protein
MKYFMLYGTIADRRVQKIVLMIIGILGCWTHTVSSKLYINIASLHVLIQEHLDVIERLLRLRRAANREEHEAMWCTCNRASSVERPI